MRERKGGERGEFPTMKTYMYAPCHTMPEETQSVMAIGIEK